MRLFKIGFFLIIVLFSLSIIPSIVSGADFIADPTSGVAPLTVTFTDTSTGSPTDWAWYFGDENFTDAWTQMTENAEWSERWLHSSVGMRDGSIVLMGGYDDLWPYNYKNDTWRSTDTGATWTLVNGSAGWSGRVGHSSVAMPDGSILLTGGSTGAKSYNDVWRSTDNGATWMQMNDNAGWSARSGHSSVVMTDGSIILMGGGDPTGNYLNDVWRSTDNGATWTLQTTNAEWTKRGSHSTVVMPDGSIVLMGGTYLYENIYGQRLTKYMNDVWRSTDNGATWTQQTANAGWGARIGHSSVVMPDSSIVLMGGDASDYMNDVWRSTDNGATWTQVNGNAEWSARWQHSTVVMPDGSIVLMGGRSPYKNDVWRFMPAGSSAQNPIHTFATPGIYQVALQAFNNDGYSSIRKTGYITVTGSSNPITNFTGEPISGMVPLTVQFIDTSANIPTSWDWSFGDGDTTNATQQNPIHTYQSTGTYTVTLTATYTTGSETKTQIDYIRVTEKYENIPVILVHGFWEGPRAWNDLTTELDNEGIPYYNFGYGQSVFPFATGDPRDYAQELEERISQIRSGQEKIIGLDNSHGYTGKFNIVCHSMGALVSRWYMEKLGGEENITQWIGIAPANHGSAWADTDLQELDSTIIPILAGDARDQLRTDSYTVTHLSQDVSNKNTKYRVIVGINKYQTADFGFITPTTVGATLGLLPFKKYVGQTPVMWIDEQNQKHNIGTTDDKGWTFLGDGVVASRQSILNGAQTDYFSGLDHNSLPKNPTLISMIPVYLENPDQPPLTTPPTPEAHFIASNHVGSTPLLIYFTDNSVGSPTEWHWTFGDGTFSNEQNPTHTYTGEYSRTYDVTLTVTNSAGSYKISKTNYVTITPEIKKGFTIYIACPVEISIMDPEGLVINKTLNQISGATYTELGLGADGTPDAKIEIPERKTGDYIITVIPKPNAPPTATFTLQLVSDDTSQQTIASNVPINQIPHEPYGIRVTSDGNLVIINSGNIPVPEFPSTIVPVISIISFLGAVLFIQRIGNH